MHQISIMKKNIILCEKNVSNVLYKKEIMQMQTRGRRKTEKKFTNYII